MHDSGPKWRAVLKTVVAQTRENQTQHGPLPKATALEDENGPEGIRTRDLRIKSPPLYLAKLLAQDARAADKPPVHVPFGDAV
jgi:hypothetical protein